jgi:hypothetical protein
MRPLFDDAALAFAFEIHVDVLELFEEFHQDLDAD